MLSTLTAFRSAGPDMAQASQPLLEATLSDTHTAALFTAAVTSITNILKEQHAPRSQARLQMFVPRDAAVVPALRRLGSETGLSLHARATVAAFFEDLEPARDQLSRYYADVHAIGLERAATLHQFTLANTWRGACRSAVSAVQLLARETSGILPELYELNAGVLTRLLEAAINGETPCIGEGGTPFLPALPQRRHAARRTLAQAAKITFARRTVPAFVRDVSSGGMGLEHVSSLVPGQFVTIELESGRCFTGEVAWAKISRAGIKFSHPLAPNDPLLYG